MTSIHILLARVSHVNAPPCKGGWEMHSNCVTRRQGKNGVGRLNRVSLRAPFMKRIAHHILDLTDTVVLEPRIVIHFRPTT